MKTALFCLLMLMPLQAQAAAVNPIEKVLSMLSDLAAKITKEGTAAQKTYDEFAEWCEDRSRNVNFEIKDGKKDVESNTASIESDTAKIASLNTKIGELADAISTDEGDLKAATKIRNSEHAEFAATEKEMVSTIDTLERAILILEKEMKKGGAAMVQMQKAGNNLAAALSVMVDASMISTSDTAKLTALVQDSNSDEDSEQGAPAATVYEGHSGGILDTLESLLDKAKASLEKTRAKENESNQNFQMLKQGLDDEIKYANQDLSDTKKNLAKTSESKATSEGDLAQATKDLNEDETTLKTLHQDCLEKANDFEAETKSRGEELKALSTARKIISEMTAGADSVQYGLAQESFLQIDSLRNGQDLANFEAVRLVRELGRKMNDAALTQLAQRMASAVRRAKGGDDPFSKVKELIKGMIEKLLNDAQSDASHKAYCDKELAESNAKKTDRNANLDKLSAEIDSMTAKSAQLKEQVAALQKQLAAMASSQAEMNSIRSAEKSQFNADSAEMEDGIKGVKMALKVLRDYYAKEDQAHDSADGAAGGIVGMLEVVESDFTKGLAEMTATEQASVADYNRESQQNEISKSAKEQSVKYKTKEFKGLDKSVSEANSDRATTKDELAAVNSYLKQLDAMCIAKPEAYGERTARREAEISGLKEALSILDGQAVLLQRTASLRGISQHKA
jgi:chromosome segregation ATPase